jgi:hypothetical protein
MPINIRQYRLEQVKQVALEKEIDKMKSTDQIEDSNSPYNTPILCLKKPKQPGEWRIVNDYRAINKVTKRQQWPLPRIEDVIESLGGQKYYATIDLKSAFFQVPLREEDRPKTAFSTHKGHYQYKVMPLGLLNSSHTFQRLMTTVLRGVRLHSCVFGRCHYYG